MEIIGKTPVNPILFYSGKIAGYFTWIMLLLQLLGFNIIKIYSFTFNEYSAFITLLLGMIIVFISLINLGSSNRLGLPIEETELITNGIYRISRNPMYVGFNLLTISSIFYTLNFLIIIIGVFSITVYHFIILAEEQFLEKRFGDSFIDYCKKVRRYI